MDNKQNHPQKSRTFKNSTYRSKGEKKPKGNGNADRQENVEKQNVAPPPRIPDYQQAGPSGYNSRHPLLRPMVSPMVSPLKPLTIANQRRPLGQPLRVVVPVFQNYTYNVGFHPQLNRERNTSGPTAHHNSLVPRPPINPQMFRPPTPNYVNAWLAIQEIIRERLKVKEGKEGKKKKKKRTFGPVLYEDPGSCVPLGVLYKQDIDKKIKVERQLERRQREAERGVRSAEEQVEDAIMQREEDERHRREDEERARQPFFILDFMVEVKREPSEKLSAYRTYEKKTLKFDIAKFKETVFYIIQDAETSNIDEYASYLYFMNCLRPPKNFYPNRELELCDWMQYLEIDEEDQAEEEGRVVSFSIGCLVLNGVGGEYEEEEEPERDG